MRRFFCSLLVSAIALPVFSGVALAAEPADTGPDRVLHFGVPGVAAMFVLPADSVPCRGVIVHAANMKLEPSRRWTEIARSLGFAHLVMQIDMKQTNRPRRLREATGPLLEIAARELGRPEIATAPLAPTGHSAGGMGLSALLPLTDRLLTAAIDCSWVQDYSKNPEARAIPLLFVIGAIPDDFKMIPAIEAKYDPARKEGAFATLGFEWGKAHAFGNAGTLFAAWFPAVTALRLPTEIGGPLREIQPGKGWLGDRTSWDAHNATIAPEAEYRGDKSAAVWLPDRAFAHVWRAFQSNNPPAQLTAETADGQVRLAKFKPASPHELITPAGPSFQLGVELTGEIPVKAVRFFAADRLLGESRSAPWAISHKFPAGTHVVFAEVETSDGNKIVTNPALIVAYPDRKQEVRKLVQE
jgi:hypothetical protein